MAEDLKEEVKEKLVKENFTKVVSDVISAMDNSKTKRKKIFKQLYKDVKKEELEIMHNEWCNEFTYEDKCLWLDKKAGIKSDDPTTFKEMLYIVELLKMRKGNIIKVFKDLKEYGKIKKADAKTDE